MVMQSNESAERFVEGLKKASSRARELGAAQKDRNWNKLAYQLDILRAEGEKMLGQKPLSEQEVIAMTDARIRSKGDGGLLG